MIPKELLITSQDLVDWIDRPPSNDDLDLCNYLENAVKNQYKYKNVIDKIKEIVNNNAFFDPAMPNCMALGQKNTLEIKELLEEVE